MLLNAIMTTLTNPEVVAAIADLADVDPIVMPPPQIVHVVSGEDIALPPLREIPGATGSRGAHLRARPGPDPVRTRRPARQVIRWLCQIAADAGLSGMERLTQTELNRPRARCLPGLGVGADLSRQLALTRASDCRMP
jgi:hypothetical protein